MYGASERLCLDEGFSEGFRLEEELYPLARQLEDIALLHGMKYFLVTMFPKGDKPEFGANHLVSNWSPELRQAYDAADVFGFSRLIARLRSEVRPFFSTECVFSDGGSRSAGSAQVKLFADHGLKSSLAYSLHGADLNHYVFVFSGVREELPQGEVASIYFSTMELLDTSFRQFSKEGPRERLSARELECLRWSAAGKSSEEIAMILNISGHTVVSYLKSAMRKLDAVNRMQAIARACRFRLL